MPYLILGIETSCDDTAVALLTSTGKLIGHLKQSSALIQATYGGVVPEVAAREHADVIITLMIKLLDQNKCSIRDIKLIAYTKYPGLKSCLFVGQVFAEGLSFLFDIPTFEANHIYGHIFSIGLTQKILYPFLSLVASGKTTALYLVKNIETIELLNTTVDDAIGEAYDKIGRVMGLAYPAGPKIDQLADPNLKVVLLAQHATATKPFSYSGIKTAAINFWKKIQSNNESYASNQILLATAFQKWVIDSVMKKIIYNAKLYSVKNVAIVGGVAANSWLRKAIINHHFNPMLVDLEFSTDNAAMIAYYAWLKSTKQNKV